MRSPQRTMAVVGWIFGGLGLVLGIIAIALVLEARAFLAGAVRAEGVVTDIVWSGGSMNRRTAWRHFSAHPVVRFEGPKGPVEFASSVGSSPPSYQVGERVSVFYPPGHPEDARLAGFFDLYLGPFILGLVALPFAGMGAGFVIVHSLGRRRRERARSLGIPVEARITAVRQDSSIRVNRRSPWVIDAEYEDRALGRTYRFTSERFWDIPSINCAPGAVVTVYYVPDDPKTYAFDLPKLQPGT